MVQLGSAWFWKMLGSVLGLSSTARTLNERLENPGVNSRFEGEVPVNAITRVPWSLLAGTWLWPVPIGTNSVAKITDTDTSRAIAARQDDSCFTLEAYK